MTPEQLAHWERQRPKDCPILTSVQTNQPMRYNPATDRACSIEEIAEQCRNAILKADACRAIDAAYDEILQFATWENDVLVPCAA